MSRKSGDDWRRLERHPISAEYEDMRGQVWEDLKARMREQGFDRSRPIVLYEGKILDGWQRQRAALDTGKEPTYRKLPKGTDAREYVDQENDYRRHESEQQVERRIAARRARVAELRREGESVRSIAEKTGEKKGTIQKDLEKIGEIVPIGTISPPNGEVKRKGGGTYPATRPPWQGKDKTEKVKPADVGDAFEGELLCSRCTRCGKAKDCAACKELNAKAAGKKATRPGPQRNGQPVYDWRAFHDHFGGLVRQVNELGKLYGAKDGPAAGKLRDHLGAFKVAFTDWHTSLTRKQTA